MSHLPMASLSVCVLPSESVSIYRQGNNAFWNAVTETESTKDDIQLRVGFKGFGVSLGVHLDLTTPVPNPLHMAVHTWGPTRRTRLGPPDSVG